MDDDHSSFYLTKPYVDIIYCRWDIATEEYELPY